ncbi:hypothetical protein HYZ82_02195 [Candidatus Nomurabacteria bacterium]|nr:hypothetical protein [Candidatus Nomurabacteria bacterium]
MDYCLSGSSGNVAMALKKLGGNPHLLGLTGPGYVTRGCHETLADHLLYEALERSKIHFISLPVLTQTNTCVIPVVGQTNGVSWGKRNRIVHAAVPRALEDIRMVWDIFKSRKIDVENTFTVVTGLRAVEMVFAKTLLSRVQNGFRVLNAKDTLCGRKEFKQILPLVDLLVLNQYEFNRTGMGLQELNDWGPKLVVVTCDKKGGFFYFSSFPRGRWFPISFPAVSFPGGRFETGAGDWFLGALVSELIRIGKTIFTVEPEEFQQVVNFAAKVAGKKITMPGGGNGPTRSQLC